MTMTLDRTDRCAKHQDEPAYYRCKDCAQVDGSSATRTPRPPRTPRYAAGRLPKDPGEIRAEIAGCDMCDDDGRLPGGHPCHHLPDAYAAAERGIAAIRAQLAGQGGTA